MNRIEEDLKKIHTKSLSLEDKESLWQGIMVKRVEGYRGNSVLSNLSFLHFSMKKIIIGSLVAVLLLGSTGIVAASGRALPGDVLFPVELAIEKLQIRLSGDEKAEELKVRFTEERVAEVKRITEEKGSPASSLVADLSGVNAIEIEADVFTDQTVVKLETESKKYGYISSIKTKSELAVEIAKKYSIPESKVVAVIDFEIEDRASRADDLDFLNKTKSTNFSEKESRDVSRALAGIEDFLAEDGDSKADIEKYLTEILVLLGDDGKLEIRREDGRIKIESKDGEVKIEVKNDDDNKGSDDDSDEDDDSDDKDDSDDSKSSATLNSNTGIDVREDDSEVFCRGEWRDEEDCDDDKDDSKDDSDDSDDDKDSDESDDRDDYKDDDEDDKDSNDDDEDKDEDDDKDDDNSGSGKED